MSAPLDRKLIGYRLVETHFGDSLQVIAAREMGDASRWPEIVAINNLVPPFITDEAGLSGVGVILTGKPVRVPASTPIADAATNPGATFLADVKLSGGHVEADASGDFLLCDGLPNLRQALVHRVVTQNGDLMYHPEYGSQIKRLLGAVTGPTASILAAQYVSASVLADPRVADVTKSTAEIIGDVINVSVEAETISGRSVAFNESV